LVVERGVAPTRVVEAFEVVKDGHARLRVRLERRRSRSSHSSVPKYWQPWSEWWTTLRGCRCVTAMSSASSTTSVFRVVDIAQPTMRRLHTSSTTARYKKPAHVGTYVMSATQSWSGPAAVKSCLSRYSDVPDALKLIHVGGVKQIHRALCSRRPTARDRAQTRCGVDGDEFDVDHG
jgi:hypothetical protein